MAIERAPFGRTGHASSRVIFGAVALDGASRAESDETLELVLAHGINHIDTAASYGDAEEQLRPWLAEHRERGLQGVREVARGLARTLGAPQRRRQRGVERAHQRHQLIRAALLHNIGMLALPAEQTRNSSTFSSVSEPMRSSRWQ